MSKIQLGPMSDNRFKFIVGTALYICNGDPIGAYPYYGNTGEYNGVWIGPANILLEHQGMPRILR